MRKLLYPKTYGEIVSVHFVGVKMSGTGFNKRKWFNTREEWEANMKLSDKIKYHLQDMFIIVHTDSGQRLHIDAFAYKGNNLNKLQIGRKIKLYQRPQDRRGIAFKFTGE